MLMIVSDCSKCSAQVLKLKEHWKAPKRYLLTAKQEAVGELKADWKGLPLILDLHREIVPEYCYSITPQLLLVKNDRIADGAIGAIECANKWDEWCQ